MWVFFFLLTCQQTKKMIIHLRIILKIKIFNPYFYVKTQNNIVRAFFFFSTLTHNPLDTGHTSLPPLFFFSPLACLKCWLQVRKKITFIIFQLALLSCLLIPVPVWIPRPFFLMTSINGINRNITLRWENNMNMQKGGHLVFFFVYLYIYIFCIPPTLHRLLMIWSVPNAFRWGESKSLVRARIGVWGKKCGLIYMQKATYVSGT